MIMQTTVQFSKFNFNDRHLINWNGFIYGIKNLNSQHIHYLYISVHVSIFVL